MQSNSLGVREVTERERSAMTNNDFSKAQRDYDRQLPPDNDEDEEQRLDKEGDKADQQRELERE